MKTSILNQGYAMIPLLVVNDAKLSQYALKTYLWASSDWAKLGYARFKLSEMTVSTTWPLKTCYRAILSLSRYAEIVDVSGNRVTLESIALAEDVILFPKTEVSVKANPKVDMETVLRHVSGGFYDVSDSEHHRIPIGDNVSNNNKTPYIYDHKSNTEQEISKEELSTSVENSIITPQHELPVKLGNSWLKRVVAVYQKLYFSTYGRLPLGLNYARVGKSLKPLKENFTEYQLALMLIQYFSWYGANGDDDFTHQRLQQNTFPLLWFPSYVDAIAVALGDVIDNSEEVEKLVDRKLEEL